MYNLQPVTKIAGNKVPPWESHTSQPTNQEAN